MAESASHERTEGKRIKESTGQSIQDSSVGKIGGDFAVKENAEFLAERVALYDEIIAEQKKFLETMPKEAIKITLPDGAVKEGTSFETTAMDIAKGISQGLADKVLVAKVKYSRRSAIPFKGLINTGPDSEEGADEKYELIDMGAPLEGDCELHLLTFNDKEGKMVFWHSSAHILGEAMENIYGCYLCIGPPVDPGFYYDSYIGEKSVGQTDFPTINKRTQKITQEKQKFEKIVLTKEQALKMFEYNPFKKQLIANKIPDGGYTTAYRCGNLIDLCTGPHIPHTGKVKAMECTKNSSTQWLAKEGNDQLQRVYGISFPTKKELTEWKHFQEEAAKRDHRNVGKQQNLFMFHQWSPGSAFFMPQGAHVYNKLMDLIRKEYAVRGYTEVVSPNMYNCDLWKCSGHYQHYKDDMFIIDVDEQEFGLKPMNCPGHCLMFDNTIRSYKELPIRYADFGVLHRNEISGALSGLTRVRRFQQDDAHIFCTQDQIMQEVLGCLDFLAYIYGLFGFDFELALSTRPEKALGDVELWNVAEEQLAKALDAFGKPWKVNPGDGAFYGPKIDIKLFDALRRQHQCGTVQLDFQLPIRFNLQYRTVEVVEKTEAEG
eukprot:CAMPEP_0115010416 /NCGR_PEP_ID=MMETSP0216-20121206/23305_1 /TAXON_ID=223996 /ORGANISM="Protocruzia adherens, Strain Boccale" /LENGTH=602 /DNA_ID=CAMNT_0002378631 /DNA_START=38 /DNA_END=1842 /DNA_ORIENTATION=-